MYAQTITYGLFAARLGVPDGRDFTREKAAWNLPKTNPFLRRLFNEIAGPDLDERIAWLVDDLARLLSKADMEQILKDFGKRTRQEDPIVHFYETFLAAYDPEMRQTRGVYYTPEPVVSYIVRSLHHIVKESFLRPLGLADANTLILDPAVGTATFLYFVIQQIRETLIAQGQAGTWNDYVEKHLLPRIFGFELLMSPYTVAHMKLSILLDEAGYDFSTQQRLGIYLTNTLDEAIIKAETLGFAGFITEEANAAAEVKKEKPIMLVLGNPPYSVSSANRGRHIEALMERYKAAVQQEQNIQPLSDDYIKFIRFAHDRIERTGYGVIGMITNHAYLAGLIHRGMREELMKSFSEIYIMNLHGNALIGEIAPNGQPDKNVFDIKQGVAITICIKKENTDGVAQVFYADLWGTRDSKYDYLLQNDISTTEWQKLEPKSNFFSFFIPKDLTLHGEYNNFWSLVDIFGSGNLAQDRGKSWGSGIKTNRDRLLIDFEKRALEKRIQILADPSINDDEVRANLGLEDSKYWNTNRERQKIRDAEWRRNVVTCLYRSFDQRWMLYQPDLIEINRGGASKFVMRNMLRPNVALVSMRRIRTDSYQHFFITRTLVIKDALSAKDNCTIFPLYRYVIPEDTTGTLFQTKEIKRYPNLSDKFVSRVQEALHLSFVRAGRGDLKNTFGPEDIMHYAYGLFHSLTYRKRYAEFLKIDFPRLPVASDQMLFRALAEKGEELAGLHLMESQRLDRLITAFPAGGSNKVEKILYLMPTHDANGVKIPGCVYINERQYFEGIEPEVWHFNIGNHQVLDRWLKDRKDRKLSFDEILHYQKVVVAIKETIRVMKEIDELIPSWPIK
jgi:predicted helicase